MKSIHGKIISLLLLLVVSLNAVETQYCSYSISSSKQSAVLHEAISISFTSRQKTKNEVMFFDLKPLPSKDYEIISIKEKRHEFNYHDAKKDFEFLLIPKKIGIIKVAFDFRVRRASDDAVAQAYRGSRDNVKSIPTIKVNIATPTVTLNIKALKQDVDAVGEFNLVMSIDKTKASSYDKVNVIYKLQGHGYLNKSFTPLQEIEGLSIFKGEQEVEPRATKDGYTYQKEWSYALIASKSYTLPAVTLKTYDYTTKQYLDKTTALSKVQITPLLMQNLLDDEELPQSDIDYKKYIAYLYNVLIFIGGFLFAKFLVYFPMKISKKEHCCPRIKSAKTAKELLNYVGLLLQKYPLEDEVKKLEDLVYKSHSKESFHSIKMQIIKKIKEF